MANIISHRKKRDISRFLYYNINRENISRRTRRVISSKIRYVCCNIRYELFHNLPLDRSYLTKRVSSQSYFTHLKSGFNYHISQANKEAQLSKTYYISQHNQVARGKGWLGLASINVLVVLAPAKVVNQSILPLQHSRKIRMK